PDPPGPRPPPAAGQVRLDHQEAPAPFDRLAVGAGGIGRLAHHLPLRGHGGAAQGQAPLTLGGGDHHADGRAHADLLLAGLQTGPTRWEALSYAGSVQVPEPSPGWMPVSPVSPPGGEVTATSARPRPRLAAPLVLGLALAAPLAGCGETGNPTAPAAATSTAPATTATTSGGPGRVLVFSKTTGFRHQSIPDGINALRDIGVQLSLKVDA